MIYLVKFFPEIIVKTKPVRRQLTQQLINNLRNIFLKYPERLHSEIYWDSIRIEGKPSLKSHIEHTLTHTPGIATTDLIESYPFENFDQVGEKVVEVLGESLKEKSFVVRVKRVGQHPFTSTELERWLGGYLQTHVPQIGPVDLHHPQVKVRIELVHGEFRLIVGSLPGLGGFPMGTQGEVLSLISGGYDSCVASYMTMRRGLKTHFLFFNLGGDAHEIGVKQVSWYLWNQYSPSHRVKFIQVPFDQVVHTIVSQVDHTHMGLVLKIMMMKAAELIANRMNIDALVTGEAIAQVSSQTLRNQALIDQSTNRLILRPLITTDKSEIIKIAREIGTEIFSAAMPEYCGVISQRPSAHAKHHQLMAQLEKLDIATLLTEALARVEITPSDGLIQQMRKHAKLPVSSSYVNLMGIIDIRQPHEVSNSPLHLPAEVKLWAIPFYQLLTNLPSEITPESAIGLYCAKGIMSQAIGLQLQDLGYQNIHIYRP